MCSKSFTRVNLSSALQPHRGDKQLFLRLQEQSFHKLNLHLAKMAREDFHLFWNTHLHTSEAGGQSPDTAVLYWHSLKEETSNFPWTRREASPRQHPLVAVARDIMTQVRVATKKMTLTVTILQNLSPCSECAAELLKAASLAKEKKVKLELSIAFVSLHRIRRPSCAQRGHACSADIFINESNDNSLALRRLSEEGVNLSTFHPSLWQFFYTFVGLGLPSPLPLTLFAGKYSGAALQQRMSEDSLMTQELQAILGGMQIASGSVSPEPDNYVVQWTTPRLSGSKKVSEYRISYKKVLLKSKECDDPRLWRVHQSVSPTPTKLSVSGEMSSCRVDRLERDSFYEVTVEALVHNMAACSAKKLFKTDDKVPVPSLATPKKLVRSNSRSSYTGSSPRSPNGHVK